VTTGETSKFWDDQVASFDDEPDHGLRDPAVREAWRLLLRSVLPARPAHIADLGCGTGSLAVLLAEDGHQVIGIDLSARMIAAAIGKASEARVAATFRQGDASFPELDASSFDAVVVRHLTWALPAPDDALRRWTTLLRAGGRLVLIEGRWSTGAGITARQLADIVRPIIPDVEVRPLTDQALWGAPIIDERYVLIART
jgi:ubiquinone/menaquinone biosynthesis C-methylase UbiE